MQGEKSKVAALDRRELFLRVALFRADRAISLQ